jgi:hypothetical protein
LLTTDASFFALLFWPGLPMSREGESQNMQITLTISDEIVREAGARNMAVIDFVESLVDKGLIAARDRPVMSSAMERIRALRSSTVETKK